jgi:hypothetical protein
VDVQVDAVSVHACNCQWCDDEGTFESFRGIYIARCCAGWNVRSASPAVAQLALVEHLAAEHGVTKDALTVPLPQVVGCEKCDPGEPCSACHGNGYVIREPVGA